MSAYVGLHTCTVKALYFAVLYFLVFTMNVISFEFILWIHVCYIITMHCQNVRVVFIFTETVHTRNLQNKSHTKFKTPQYDLHKLLASSARWFISVGLVW